MQQLALSFPAHKHVVCLSGGHSSALVAVEVVRRYGPDDVVLLNHDTNPREALCVWAGYQVTEIRGPGELTTAEQLAAAQARATALEAALRHYAPTCGDCDRLATHESHDGVAVSCDACRTTRWRRRPDWRELTHTDVLRSLDTPEPGR